MKLYEITDNSRELMALADSGLLTQSDIQDTMDGLSAEFDEKVKSCLEIRQSMLADVSAIDKEIERLTELKKKPQSNADWLGDYVKNNMIKLGKNKVTAGTFIASLRKPSLKLGEIDESKLSSKYFKVVPETKKLDRRILLADAKAGKVDVELIESDINLTIK